MRRTPVLAVAATALAAAIAVPALTVTSPKVSAATKPAASSTVKWAPCPPDVVQYVPLECAKLAVPLDYRKPDGRQIELALSRLASKDPSKRRGILLTNPGGPGSTGIDYPGYFARAGASKDVLDAYDVIGMDPRGVGRSAPVTCDLTPAQQSHGSFATYAHSAADVAKEAPYARAIAKQCATSKTASMLPFITSANTARDLDRVRAALGEEKASYLGLSYGSYLGAVYTTMFPRTSDRVVIDSVMGPGGYDENAMRMFGRGLEDRFPDFQKYVVAHPELGLGTTPPQVKAKFFELARKLRVQPVKGMTETDFRATAFGLLYGEANLPVLAKVWQDIDAGKPLEVPPATGDDNAMAARLYVACTDSRWPTSVREYQRNVAIDRIKHPMLGAAAAGIQPCAFWPNRRVEPPVKITDRGPSNVLLVQNERDPGTPLVGAQKMRRALGDRATMVTVDGGGHGVYPVTKNTCAKDAVVTFLTTGERPSRDLACAAEAPKK
ncbi:alpha/beta hydrolase [Kribbella sp. DT2]|uniref:alpha/beta hydrolase n=1 Tax=Kribbella sp. DT2 TaxID=3393427 RepID=UPI003CF89132